MFFKRALTSSRSLRSATLPNNLFVARFSTTRTLLAPDVKGRVSLPSSTTKPEVHDNQQPLSHQGEACCTPLATCVTCAASITDIQGQFPQAEDVHITQIDPPPGTFDHLKHIKDYTTAYKAFNYTETDCDTILKILDNCSSLQPDLYISRNNAVTAFALLKNVVTCFDTNRSDIKRYRQCNVLLGMKNSGKSVLVSVLQRAIQEQYPNCITVAIECSQLHNKTIAELVAEECKTRGIEAGTSLQDVLKALAKDKRSLLVVVDEAQGLYPDKETPEKSVAFNHASVLVDELHILAQQPGCVCWLTGSSQALHHLAFAGRHPDYYGVYRDLNHKKYTPLHHLALRDAESVQEFLQAETSTIMPPEEIATLYERYGGAMGDLSQQKSLPESYIEAWDKTAQAVLLALVLAQPTTSASKPWNLLPIPGRTARLVVERANPGCSAEIELQRMCDLYLLERDNLGQYHIAYPDAIHYCNPSGDNILIERAYQAAKLLLEDDILGFLAVVLQAMHNIPYDATKNIRRFEDHPHSTVHTLLWMCCPRGVSFDSGTKNQVGILDVVIVTTKYRHYLELKAEKGDSPAEALQQITDKGYTLAFPRTSSGQQLPAFRYGIKWTDKSTHAIVEVATEGDGENTDLWKNKLALTEGRHTISV